MTQLFHPGANTLARLLLAGIVLGPNLLFLVGASISRSGYVTGEGRFVDQTVPFTPPTFRSYCRSSASAEFSRFVRTK